MGDGEDGPTHQREQLANLRAVPGLTLLRPGDANEVVEAYAMLCSSKTPGEHRIVTSGSADNRSKPVQERAAGRARGAYVLADAPRGEPQVILIASGSEVSLAVEAHEQLLESGVRSRVVSMRSWDIFQHQDRGIPRQCVPPGVTAPWRSSSIQIRLGALCRSRGRSCRYGNVRRVGTTEGIAAGIRLHCGERGGDGEGATEELKSRNSGIGPEATHPGCSIAASEPAAERVSIVSNDTPPVQPV